MARYGSARKGLSYNLGDKARPGGWEWREWREPRANFEIAERPKYDYIISSTLYLCFVTLLNFNCDLSFNCVESKVKKTF